MNPATSPAFARRPPSPDFSLRRDLPHIAVVDIGSNSVRLVVYDSLSRAPWPRFNEKSLCRLGAGLSKDGDLDPDAMHRTEQALHRYAEIAKAMEVERIEVIATEALRRARNADILIKGIKRSSGLDVRVLSGSEEARFAALGIVAGLYRPFGLAADMGGGSLEVAEVQGDRVGEGVMSVPLGALLVQPLLERDPLLAKAAVDERLQALPPTTAGLDLFPIGGGWRALARVHAAMHEAPLRVTHGYALDAGEARAFAKSIWNLPAEAIENLPDVPSSRVRTLAAAALVLDRLLKRVMPKRAVFSALGLREGWLYAQLDDEERQLDPLVEGAKAFGRPRARVPSFDEALMTWTGTVFADETEAERRLRLASCALSDIMWADHKDVQALQGFERIINFPFIGLDHVERVFLGAVILARHGGNANDLRIARQMAILTAEQRRRAEILGRTFQLAHRFSGSVPSILATARLRFEPDIVRLEIQAGESVPDSDAVRTRLKQLARASGARRSAIVSI